MRRDWIGLAAVAAWLGALLAFRAVIVEPRAWAAACVIVYPPLACLPRAGLLWMQAWGLWGLPAVALGLWSLRGAPFAVAVAAVALGAAGVVNYNASWGMLGAALGGWAWVTCAGSGAERARPA